MEPQEVWLCSIPRLSESLIALLTSGGSGAHPLAKLFTASLETQLEGGAGVRQIQTGSDFSAYYSADEEGGLWRDSLLQTSRYTNQDNR